VRYVQWVQAYTPTVPFISTPFYYYLGPGATAAQYRTRTMDMLNAYHGATAKPLNIDEFGMHMGNGWTWKDQSAWYEGFFSAVGCDHPNFYQTFAWVGGNDFPALGQCNFYGLFSEITCGGDCPSGPSCYYVWQGRPAWDILADYYRRAACLTASGGGDAAGLDAAPATAIPAFRSPTMAGTAKPLPGRRPSAAPVIACTPSS
jgi:hypothetical protein